MAILVTGGAGYIGSHTVVELQNAGYDVVVLDNLSNASEKSLDRVSKITGKPVKFYKADILDRDALNEVFDKEDIDSCIHFAGLKAVGESVQKPWEYYENNIAGTLTLVDVMRKHNVKNIIFSSSATVYGDPAMIPITEECPKGQCTNPYGWTKSMLEQVLTDIQKADPEWNVVLLRYFNPIGAHKSGLIGENPNGIPNNLMPYITQVAVGKLKELGVFGNDYDTPDGTGVRDYIHVVDLAKGHVKALKKIEDNSGLSIYNLGTGKGYSVLDIVKNFEAATGVKIPYVIKPRRPGDIATCYSNADKAKIEDFGDKYELFCGAVGDGAYYAKKVAAVPDTSASEKLTVFASAETKAFELAEGMTVQAAANMILVGKDSKPVMGAAAKYAYAADKLSVNFAADFQFDANTKIASVDAKADAKYDIVNGAVYFGSDKLGKDGAENVLE